VIVCGLPVALSDDTAQVAAFPLTVAPAQSVVVPSLKSTVPALLGLGEIVAVNVTELPYVLGFAELVTVVVVVATVTVTGPVSVLFLDPWPEPLVAQAELLLLYASSLTVHRPVA